MKLKSDYKNNIYIIKPETLCGSVGVGLETDEYSLDICQREFGPCLRQPYHPGPWEIRLCKDGVYGWKKPFVFVAGWKYKDWIDPPHFEMDVVPDWIHHIQNTIDYNYIDTSFLTVDIRANENEYLILEINGGMGIGFEWVDNISITWLFSRIQAGLYTLRGFDRILPAIQKIMQRQIKGKKWEFEII
jgi:hypothetical protein